jgi:hypothetical protein
MELRHQISAPAKRTPTASTNPPSAHTPLDSLSPAPAQDYTVETFRRNRSRALAKLAEMPLPFEQFSRGFSFPSTIDN